MSEFIYVDPTSIVIDRDARQRKNITDLDELKNSIMKVGIINPIIVRSDEGMMRLVAGERRLTSALELMMPLVPIRFFEQMTKQEARIVELEENIKRQDLAWRDLVRTVGEIHRIFVTIDPDWTIQQTAEEISTHHSSVRHTLHVYLKIDDPILQQATGIENAYGILTRMAERRAETIVGSIIAAGARAFDPAQTPAPSSQPVASQAQGAAQVIDFDSAPSPTPAQQITLPPVPLARTMQEALNQPTKPVICADFTKWIKQYEGPKFNLIHCDFPYGTYKGDDSTGTYIVNEFYDNTPDVYWALTEALVDGLDKIMSHSAHMIFWFDMKFYTETKQKFTKFGLNVHPHPWVWHKTNGGTQPGTAATHPRRTIDTAFLCFRGERPLAKPGPGSYAAPMVHNKFHPSQKPEPVLRVLLSMFTDETTSLFDPTCGSGSALRAAEDLGAKTVLGLELDSEFTKSANAHVESARVLRTMRG